MSTIQEQMVALLSPVIAIYPLTAPQGSSYPYATYQRVANPVENVLNGAPPIENTRLQIDIWATTYSDVQALARQVKAAMQAWTVQNVLISDYDLYEQEAKIPRVLLEFSIWQ